MISGEHYKWKADTKAMIALEGLEGRPVAELCMAHQISQAPYHQWCDQFLANARPAFETQILDQRLTHLQRENAQLHSLIGDPTVEHKTNGAIAGFGPLGDMSSNPWSHKNASIA